MVPWTHWREPRLGRLLTEWTSEFTVFNLVIRVSKGKQSALFRVSPVVSFLVELLAAVLGNHLFFLIATLTAAKPPFFNCSRKTDRCHSFHTARRQDMPSGVVLLSFGSLGEANKSCT